MFSWGSVLGCGRVWERTFLMAVVHEVQVPTAELREAAFDEILRFFGGSLRQTFAGRMPERGFRHEDLASRNLGVPPGQPVAGGFKLAFGGFRGDRAAMVKLHKWHQWWHRTDMCELCHAQLPTKKS